MASRKGAALYNELNLASGQVTRTLKDMLGDKKFADTVAILKNINQNILDKDLVRQSTVPNFLGEYFI